MIQDNAEFDKFEAYEELYNPTNTDRQARRKRKPRVNHKSKKSDEQVMSELADDTRGFDSGFATTYQPARYEAGWLQESLSPFYLEELIIDVLAQVKGGKEASVYRCQAHPGTGHTWLAAKVYRPRKFRNLRNDKMYREGRHILTAEGRPIKPTDNRIIRALGKKSAFGVQVEHTSWLMHEYLSLVRLHQAGGAVPQPLAVGENAILMSYHGDAGRAARTLNEIDLEPEEAERLYREVLRNIELILQQGLIHGDLSAYNILYWQGEITLIDFPQVTEYATNPQAHFILQRDLTRICQYFIRQGVACDAKALLRDYWQQYIEVDANIRAADESRRFEAEEMRDERS